MRSAAWTFRRFLTAKVAKLMWARDDLAEYRAGYPTKKDRPELDRNVRFYRNEIPCRPENIKIDDLHREWRGDYGWLEQCHSYIQWLFPIQEAGLNPQAQVLQKHEITTMRADPAIIDRIKTSYELMLDFYGFRLADRSSGVVVRAQQFEDRFENLNYSGHNYLRITRMLKLLGELGLEHFKTEWLRAFEREIYETKALPNCRSSYEDYWVGTIYDDATRKAFVDRYKLQPAPEYGSWGSRYRSSGIGSAVAAAMPFMGSSDSMLAEAPAPHTEKHNGTTAAAQPVVQSETSTPHAAQSTENVAASVSERQMPEE